MGSGYRGDFGATKGSRSHILAASKNDSVLVISTLSGASKSIRDKADRSPINIPSGATYKEQQKDGYKQVIFKFERDGVKYESRWHEKTPNSPNYMGKIMASRKNSKRPRSWFKSKTKREIPPIKWKKRK